MSCFPPDYSLAELSVQVQNGLLIRQRDFNSSSTSELGTQDKQGTWMDRNNRHLRPSKLHVYKGMCISEPVKHHVNTKYHVRNGRTLNFMSTS